MKAPELDHGKVWHEAGRRLDEAAGQARTLADDLDEIVAGIDGAISLVGALTRPGRKVA